MGGVASKHMPIWGVDMPRYESRLEVSLPVDTCMVVCREAVAQLGWRMQRLEARELVAKESSDWWKPSGVEINVLLVPTSEGSTLVTLRGSVLGLAYRSHLLGQIGNLQNRIELLARQHQQCNVPRDNRVTDIAAHLERLASLHKQGVLSDEEFGKAKERLLYGR